MGFIKFKEETFMGFLSELKRSKLEQYTCDEVYNNFKDKKGMCPTGPSGPGGGSWWWLESGKSLVSDGDLAKISITNQCSEST